MNRGFLFFIILLLFTVSVFPQSGRRIKKPKPVKTPVIIDENSYSESRSYKPRRIYPPNYKKRNEKKDKKVPVKNETVTNGEDDIIRVDSTLVTIPISVYNRNGLYIRDLRKQEIKIFEDGVEQEIDYFGTSEKPFTVALMIDTSPSTDYRIEEIRRAAKAFVDQLMPHDKVVVIEFDNDPQVLTRVTNNRQEIYRGIDKADFGSGTALYDAVDYTINKIMRGIPGRKAVVLFTDGVDTVSRRSYDSSLQDAEESESIIFPIYYNTFMKYAGRTGGLPPVGRIPPIGGSRNRGYGNTAEEYALGKKYLDDLAAYTGGRVFVPEKTFGGLRRAFEGIAEELRRQYTLAYYPKKEGKNGERRKIKVRVYRPKLIVRARDSYIVGSN